MDLVNCLDQERQIVRRSRADQCSGRVVSDAEAKRVRQQRRAYIAESLEAESDATIIGKRLTSIGAGFFVDRRGSIVTNAHVVKGCSELAITSPNGSMSRVKLVATQPSRDLALLSSDLKPTTVAEIARKPDLAGSELFIVGYPNQGLPPLIPLLTEGMLTDGMPSQASGRGRSPLSFKAALRPGNSGGPVLNRAGQVIGVVFAAVDTSTIYKEQGRIIRDRGVAIPSPMLGEFLASQGVSADFKPASTQRYESDRLLKAAKDYVIRVECWN
ncbi:S1 family peptidase [Halochromatium roseum]|uniref:S1 family peptidase n=1 Tax=Halochromatium roseum TaxID=391920 RepID=UPI0019128854|nr:serine protease [Halochromatium roseum]